MNAIGELIELADTITRDRERLLSLRRAFDSLEHAANEIDRSWSGSNIGYHARVYYRGFQPTPAGALFSSEWGLMDRWPTHQPDPGWQLLDHKAVVDAVIARAATVDPQKLEQDLAPFRKLVGRHKENLASILTAAMRSTKDRLLEKNLDEIESLETPAPGEVARRFLPKGQIFTRDSLALGEGLCVAPHQSVIALPYSGQITENNLSRLEEIARLIAAHLQRLNPGGRSGVQTGGAITFIGHGRSPLWRELKDFLQDRLHLSVSEFNAVSAAGIPTVERLTEMLNSAAFAFIIMTGEDEQADGQVHARQNVIHEAGLFQGRLGFGKAIILLEDGCADFSNIHGLGVILFPRGQISACFEEVRKVLEREKLQ